MHAKGKGFIGKDLVCLCHMKDLLAGNMVDGAMSITEKDALLAVIPT